MQIICSITGERMFYNKLLTNFTQMCRDVFQENLIGVYLHGSASLGCFNPQKSDLDLILIVKNAVEDSVKMKFMKNTVRLNRYAPLKGIELSIIKKEFCKPFIYPTPFELHFSNAHLDSFNKDPEYFIKNMNGTDKDLAAHFTVINKCGIVLFGENISDVFGEVPKADYIDSIWLDVKNARRDIDSDPVYIILNLCRVLAYLKENLVLSKKSGGEWGCRTLPYKYNSLIKNMLCNYISGENIPADSAAAHDFSEYMISEIKKFNL